MALFRCGGGSSSGIEAAVVATTHFSNVSVTATKSGNTVTVSGTFKVATNLAANELAFAVVPPPASAQTINGALVFPGTTSRNVSLTTSGQVILLTSSMQSGYSWNVNFSYTV